MIALNRLNRVLAIDREQRIARRGAGRDQPAVSAAAAPHGLRYAPDPSSQSVCTIGGNVAFNSGGAHCLRHGMTSNHVLGIEAVLPDGEVVELGGESLRARRARTGSGCSAARKGCSASRSRSRCGCCPGRRGDAHGARRLSQRWRRRATPWRGSSPPGCCRSRWRSWTRWRSRRPRRRSSPATRTRAALLIVELEGEREVVERRRRAARRADRRVRRDRGARDRRSGRARPDLEGAQERVLGGRLARARLHRAGRRGAAHAAGRGAGRDRAAEREPAGSASRTSSTPATATCTR